MRPGVPRDSLRFDGVAVGADAGLGPFVVAYGGYAALRAGSAAGYRHLASAEGAVSSYSERELERGQHLLFGGQAGYRARSRAARCRSTSSDRRRGTERSDIGLDFEVALR